MEFIKTEGSSELAEALKTRLNGLLDSNKKVLWLVPGGSNITVAVKVMVGLNSDKLNNLTIMLTDERYGVPGHADSNFTQLFNSGFKPRTAKFEGFLRNEDLEKTISRYDELARRNFSQADEVVGFFGMGPDSHIAGILPDTPATVVSEQWATGYASQPFTRLTLTPYALSHVKVAYAGVFGSEKKEALDRLCKSATTIAEQPSRILCHIPEVYVYNDQIGDKQ